jgi:competence ComEA-like helix-hairpin-helix protein
VEKDESCYLTVVIRYFLILWLALLPCPASEELVKFAGCVLVETAWADGDSFSVRFPDGKERTIRLYGVDCIEIHVSGDDSNARRLRDQRRYFGIDDILTAKTIGESARLETAKLLASPFTIFTVFADGRGDGRFERVYGFVETADGKNLSEWLVTQGLARAFGVVRQLQDGTSGSEWKEQLADLELTAARAGRGAWAKTDWESLPKFRKEARDEIAELESAKGTLKAVEGKPVDINHASKGELMTLPGIGEKTALSIIKARPFQSTEDLRRIKGIGESTHAKIKAYIRVTQP